MYRLRVRVARIIMWFRRFTASKFGADGRVPRVRRQTMRFRNIARDPGRYRNP